MPHEIMPGRSPVDRFLDAVLTAGIEACDVRAEDADPHVARHRHRLVATDGRLSSDDSDERAHA